MGLNIENYYTFFVQQGWISSILSFNNKELLKLIEETAGVYYYKNIKVEC